MKKLILLSLSAFLFVANATAQTTETKKPESKEEKVAAKAKKEAELEELIKELGLTDEQKAKYKEILATAATKGKELKDNTTMTAEEKETAKKKINDEKNAAIKELLGEEKYKQHNAIKKRQKEMPTTPAAQ